MKLFTKAINDKLFEQYHKGSNLEDQVVVAKIFNPYGRGAWYLINSDPNDPDYLWAIVDLFEVEVGSCSRSELEGTKVPPFGLGLERDTSFESINAAELFKGASAGKRYAEGGETEGENVVLKDDGTWIKINDQEEQELESEKKWKEGLTWQEQHEFNPQFAAGGTINDSSSKVKAKVVTAIGLDTASKYMDKEWVISPYHLLERAVRANLLSVDEIDKKVWQAALEEAEQIDSQYRGSGQGIGSSDTTYFLKTMLDGAGLKTDFINNRLVRVDKEGKPIKIENKFASGGELKNENMHTETTEGFTMKGKHWTFSKDGKHIYGTAEIKDGGVVRVHLQNATSENMHTYHMNKKDIIDGIKEMHEIAAEFDKGGETENEPTQEEIEEGKALADAGIEDYAEQLEKEDAGYEPTDEELSRHLIEENGWSEDEVKAAFENPETKANLIQGYLADKEHFNDDEDDGLEAQHDAEGNTEPMPESFDEAVITPSTPEHLSTEGYDKGMALANVDRIKEYAEKIDALLTNNTELEPWVIAKMARVEVRIIDIKQALKFQQKHPTFEAGGELVKSMCLHIAKYAQTIHEIIEEGVPLMAWIENNLAISSAYIDDVYHHLDYKINNKEEEMPEEDVLEQVEENNEAGELAAAENAERNVED